VQVPLPPLPGQHGWARPPHAVQTLAWQATLPAVQVLLAQQACVAPPHEPQDPFVQVPPMFGHVAAELTQFPPTQHPPPPQVPAAQHVWPGPPQTSHCPVPLHTLPVSHWRPGQQV
jgi:hypothetical protein